jgi:hypothetical protein
VIIRYDWDSNLVPFHPGPNVLHSSTVDLCMIPSTDRLMDIHNTLIHVHESQATPTLYIFYRFLISHSMRQACHLVNQWLFFESGHFPTVKHRFSPLGIAHVEISDFYQTLGKVYHV